LSVCSVLRMHTIKFCSVVFDVTRGLTRLIASVLYCVLYAVICTLVGLILLGELEPVV